MPTSLRVIQEAMHADGPDLVAAVAGANAEDVAQLCDAVLDNADVPQLGLTDTLVRPLINARMGTFRRSGLEAEYSVAPTLGGLNLLTATDPRYAGAYRFSAGVGRALLYCHQLIVEDPLALTCHMYAMSAHQLRPAARRMVQTAVQTALETDELVQAGVLIPYWISPNRQRRTAELIVTLSRAHRRGEDWAAQSWDAFEAIFVDGLHPALRELWQRIRGGDRSPDLQLLRDALSDGEQGLAAQFIQAVDGLKPSIVTDNVIEILAIAIDDMLALGGQPDLFAPSALFTRLLLAPMDQPNDVDARRLRELARIDVPRWDDLSWRDVIAIRRQEESFELWRVHLARGLDRAAEQRRLGLWFDAGQIVREELLEARQTLIRAQGTSTFLARAGRATVSFVLGALGGGIAGLPSGPNPAAVSALGAGIGSATVTLTQDHRAPSDARYQHYVLFDR